jgi:hypothetical protein
VIVTNRPSRRKRKAKAALPVEIAVPRVVQAIPKGRAWRLKELEPDPEADARVAEFFARMTDLFATSVLATLIALAYSPAMAGRPA